MRRIIIFGALLAVACGIALGWGSISEVAADMKKYFYGDPDLGPFEANLAGMSREEFMTKKAEYIAGLRGVEKDKPFNPQHRIDAIGQLESQEIARTKMPESNFKTLLDLPWTEIGPNPIPNGQVVAGSPLAVSGRTIAIAVHPTDANIVYVGTAQGGLYRTTDGGTTWTPLMDSAQSMAIGAIAIAPTQPDTVYVGTGEQSFSCDSYFGVGIYRITDASTGSPTVSGPFGGAEMSGRAVGEIVVDPANAATIFATTTSGIGGIGCQNGTLLPARGLFRSTDALNMTPTFTKLTVTAAGENLDMVDMAIDPGDGNRLLVSVPGSTSAQSGIWLSTTALGAATFTRQQAFSGGISASRTELAINRIGGIVTAYAASANAGGTVYRSGDGGVTWTLQVDDNFCGGQCFYNIGIAVDPTNASNVYVGGTGSGTTGTTFGISTNSGVSFIDSQNNLHTDTHAIAVAPSAPSTIYFGSDGGIYKSTDSGTTWTSLNNTTFRATQFMSLAVHPTDGNFTIGGTQDNGTECLGPCGTNVSGWIRADFGDGGYSQIDQNATDTANVRMYHTYFNTTAGLMGYATVATSAAATEGNWAFRGCNGVSGNGISCTATATLFYAPIQRGPGNPNTMYFGNDRLYRSVDNGTNHTLVSQGPIASGVAISAIGVAPTNDNVRVVGLSLGQIFGTTTGANPLVNMDPANAIPNNYIGRVVIDPTNANTAYVTLAAFGVVNVWKTTTLNALIDNIAPTWTAATGTGANTLPQVPVNAFLIDPVNPNLVYAGTDIGVYVSGDQGTNWFPLGTGLPRVAVFDMAMAPGRIVRIATHGRGMWQIPALEPTAANVRVSGRVFDADGRVIRNSIVSLTAQDGSVRTAITNAFGHFRFDDVPSGASYVLDARAKSYTFTPRTINVSDELTDADMIALP